MEVLVHFFSASNLMIGSRFLGTKEFCPTKCKKNASGVGSGHNHVFVVKRDERNYGKSYREWCESAGVTDRAQKKLFSTSVLRAEEENTLRSAKRSSTRHLLDRINGTARWVDAQTCVSFSPRKLEKIVPI